MSKRIKWHYSPPTMVTFGPRWPEQVEDRGDVAVPLRQSEGCFSYILWPQKSLYATEQEALGSAIEHHQKIASEALERLQSLTKRLTAISKN